jgi:hypothetical protein
VSRWSAVFWPVFAVMAAVYGAIMLWSLPQVSALAGGLVPFDLRPTGYTPDEARALVVALGSEGRVFYRDTQLWLDAAYPALMAVVLSLALTRLAPGNLGRVLAVIVVIGAGCDYRENAAIARMLTFEAGDIPDALARAASHWTVAKSIAVSLCQTALVILLLRTGWRHWRGRGV